ncbi:hypothetical protein PENSPDRAFT_749582 [Peniophora sp. CONT]|nr:hypothetical protein PENSPDRAFT_749582 [Peniophora sp. CONT]
MSSGYRTKQTARKSTGGKAPNSLSRVVNPGSSGGNTRSETASTAAPTPKPKQTARKTTGGSAPRPPSHIMMHSPRSPGASTARPSATASPVARPKQTARKTTGGSTSTSLSSTMRTGGTGVSNDFASRTSSSGSATHRTKQTARKSTGGHAPGRSLSAVMKSESDDVPEAALRLGSLRIG